MTTKDGLNKRSGGQILVDQLKVQGVDTVFLVPGESYLPVLDALFDVQSEIKVIICRQEGGAAYMAEAYAKVTGKPGVCLVTRGPGASNASIGIHTAYQDSSPVILLIGQVGSDVAEREAFQEIDFRRMFGQMAKWVTQIDRTDRIPEFVNRAFSVSISGRPGPVVISLPEDMLTERAEVQDGVPSNSVNPSPSRSEINHLFYHLQQSKRPLIIVGGGSWTTNASRGLQEFVQENNLPVACTFRRQDLIDNYHQSYCGDIGIGVNPALTKRVKDADLLIAIGPRLGEMTTGGYSLIDVPVPTQTLIHVHAGIEELGKVYQAQMMINSGMEQFVEAIREIPKLVTKPWSSWTKSARNDYLEHIKNRRIGVDLDFGKVIEKLKKVVPRDTIITNGAGNYTGWIQRYWQFSSYPSQLAPTSGAMGYGVPAAIAAKIAKPEREVVSFSGDGCFLMNGQELATAAQYGLKILFFVVNNGMYGTIRLHQERSFPDRVIGTDLANPDFVRLAQSYGLHAERVTSNDQIEEIVEKCLSASTASLIELVVDSDQITVGTTISEIRKK